MEKIVIATSKLRLDPSLLACINALFPDCKIEVLFKDVGNFDKPTAEPSSRWVPKDITEGA